MATTTLMPLPKQRYESIIGTPLVGGRVYTYAAGTNNPKPTYTDAAGTVAQQNPIPLNARGEPDNPIYWSGNYRVEVRDALNNIIYSVDNYNTDPGGLWGLRNDLAGPGGPDMIGYQGRKLGDLLRETVNIADYPTLRAAIEALPAAGGIVDVPVGRWKSGVWEYSGAYMAKDNVTIRGVKMPAWSNDLTHLQGGSIIEGRFNVFANNFAHMDIGYDMGSNVVADQYGGVDTHTANQPNGGTWDAFAFGQPNQGAPLAQRQGFYAKNVIGLLKDSGSYGHAMLMEGFTGGYIDNVIGIGGIHGLVIKASNVTAGYIAGYCASVDHVILKSDSYAPGSNIKIDTVECAAKPPGSNPWFVPAVTTYGLFLNPATNNMDTIKIGKARLYGATALLAVDGAAQYYLDNFSIGQLEIEGFGMVNAIGIKMVTVIFYRCKFGTVTINNVADGVAYAQTVAAGGYGSDPLFIDSLSFSGQVTLRAIQALGYGRYIVNHLRQTNNTNTLYSIADTARVFVGFEDLGGVVTKKWDFNAPALTAGWQQYAGNQSFKVKLKNFGVVIEGLLQPIGAGTPAVVSLPVYLRPSQAVRMPAIGKAAGGANTAILVGADPGVANLVINDGLNTTGTETYLSLQGVHFSLE